MENVSPTQARVHTLAAELSTTARQLLRHLHALGSPLISAASVVPPDVAASLRTSPPVFATAPDPNKPTPPDPLIDAWQRLIDDWQREDWENARVDHPDLGAFIFPEDGLTTSEAATFAGVTPATIRQWVSRGHLEPVGRRSRSATFNPFDVQAAGSTTSRRARTATGRRPHFPEHKLNALVTASDAATAAKVAPATIRSWVARGNLHPVTPAGKRPQLFRLGDVLDTRYST